MLNPAALPAVHFNVDEQLRFNANDRAAEAASAGAEAFEHAGPIRTDGYLTFEISADAIPF